MALPASLRDRLVLPLIGGPMLVPCHPPLTIAQCKAGVLGVFPALSARPQSLLEPWIIQIKEELAAYQAAHPAKKVAPFGVNQMAHKTNGRLHLDMEVCVKHQVPVIVTSLGARADIVKEVHAYGGIVLHDAMTMRHAFKALEQGVDGLILLCAGAGGHGGYINPYAFVSEIRRHYDGLLGVAGCVTNGRGILATQVLGADFVYMGTRFVATPESRVQEAYRQMLVDSSADDVLYTDRVNGVAGSWLKPSLRRLGLDPDNLTLPEERVMQLDAPDFPKAWTEIWSGSQAVGDIVDVAPVATVVKRLTREYQQALADARSLQAW
jgi:nitronate monooxygenase